MISLKKDHKARPRKGSQGNDSILPFEANKQGKEKRGKSSILITLTKITW